MIDIANVIPKSESFVGLLAPLPHRQGRRRFEEASAGDTMTHASNVEMVETFGRGGAAVPWNSPMLSHHRRCSSAPNFLSSWRGAGLPSLSSGVLAPRLRDHTIPEGQRLEASPAESTSCWNSLAPRAFFYLNIGSTTHAGWSTNLERQSAAVATLVCGHTGMYILNTSFRGWVKLGQSSRAGGMRRRNSAARTVTSIPVSSRCGGSGWSAGVGCKKKIKKPERFF